MTTVLVPRTGPACAERKRGSSYRPGCRVRRYRRTGWLPDSEGAPPLARGRDRGFARSPAGFPHLSLPNEFGSCKTTLLAGRPDGWVIPLRGRRPSPCYPRSRRRAGVQRSAALTPRRGGGDSCPHRNSSRSTATAFSGANFCSAAPMCGPPREGWPRRPRAKELLSQASFHKSVFPDSSVS